MSSRVTSRLVPVVILLAAACAREPGPKSAPSSPPAAARLHGFRLVDEPRAELPEVIHSPSGRHIVPGERDRNGVLLPLDAHLEDDAGAAGARPRPPVASGPRARSLAGSERLGDDDGHTQSEAALAIEGSTVIAGWNSFTDASALMGVGRSADGGDTWSWRLFDDAEPTMSDPSVAAGGNGRWYFAYIANTAAVWNFNVYVRHSTDDGLTWEPPVKVTDTPSEFDDKCYLAARGDTVLVAYAVVGVVWPAPIHAAVSADGGRTFTVDRVVSPGSAGGQAPVPLVAPDGTLHVVWRDSYGESLWIASSTDGGLSWTPDRRIADLDPLGGTLAGGFRNANVPSASVDPSTGALVVVWASQPSGDADVHAVRSTDGGATWTPRARVNDDAAGSEQFFPWVAVGPDGVAHAIWYDRRHDPLDIDVYYACSPDGGVTWGANRRVTAASFTPVLPWEGGAAAFIGDYNGIAAGDGLALALYQDARLGEQDVWVDRLECVPDPCAVTSIDAIERLLAAKSASLADVELEWQGDAAAGDGYNVHHVAAKVDLPACAGCGPASQPVAGCVPTGAVGTTACTHRDAVAATAGSRLFYQVRGVCDGSEAAR